ncbi:MAG: TlyA family RNA methyltransferase [Deltaproteobacteria bacterium]|nr:TlyA family RNA methyltransferase [Deltaproteobacteria bacterium]
MSSKSKIRADDLLVKIGLAADRRQAASLIMAGLVFDQTGQRIDKAGSLRDSESLINLKSARRYVSRGGLKLEGALDDFALDLKGLKCLDLGASTGGFTDCLLQKGAAAVTALDVGKGLLDFRLRIDPRVKIVENFNARFLYGHKERAELGEPFDLITTDLSFISLKLVIPQAATLMNSRGLMLVLVKPQFELPREQVGPGGVVIDHKLIMEAVDSLSAFARSLVKPLVELKRSPSKLKGRDGNQEVFLLLGPSS